MKVGDSIKVHLPGESPWATVTAVHHETVVQGRIDNHLQSDAHSFEFGDVLTFQWRGTPQAPELFAWEVSPPHEQIPIGPQAVDDDAPPTLASD